MPSQACEQLDMQYTEDDHCSQSLHSGKLEQMAIYISVKQLNEGMIKILALIAVLVFDDYCVVQI